MTGRPGTACVPVTGRATLSRAQRGRYRSAMALRPLPGALPGAPIPNFPGAGEPPAEQPQTQTQQAPPQSEPPQQRPAPAQDDDGFAFGDFNPGDDPELQRIPTEIKTVADMVRVVGQRDDDTETIVTENAIYVGGIFAFAEAQGWVKKGQTAKFVKEHFPEYSYRRVQTFRRVFHHRAAVKKNMEILDRFRSDFKFPVPRDGVAKIETALKIAPIFANIPDNPDAMTQAVGIANSRLKPKKKAKPPPVDEGASKSFASRIDWLGHQDPDIEEKGLAFLMALERMQVVQERQKVGVMIFLAHEDFKIIADFAQLSEEHGIQNVRKRLPNRTGPQQTRHPRLSRSRSTWWRRSNPMRRPKVNRWGQSRRACTRRLSEPRPGRRLTRSKSNPVRMRRMKVRRPINHNSPLA